MIRWLAAVAVTAGANLLLLLLMARLVEGGPAQPSPAHTPAIAVDLVQLRRQPPAPPAPRHHLPPPPPAQPPPPPPPAAPATGAPRLALAPTPLPAMQLPLRLEAGPHLNALVPAPEAPALETDVTPLVRIDPRYPRRALRAHIEGQVVVELTIGPDGGVSAPRIVSAQPEGVFEDAVLRALPHWRFAPRLVDGRPVARRALQTIRFTLAERPR